ncbi:MAG: hypothetical protein AAGJ40_21185 [Planctomycetota bacterium]
MNTSVRTSLGLLVFLLGCGTSPEEKSRDLASRTGDIEDESFAVTSDPASPNFDIDARADLLRANSGPFFLEPNDAVVDLRVFKPNERRKYELEDIDNRKVNMFLYVDAPQDLIDRVCNCESGTPNIGLIEVTNDKFDKKGIGVYRVQPWLTGHPPWEIAVENLTDQPLLFQIVRFEGAMSEEGKAVQGEVNASRERALKSDRYQEALQQWPSDPIGPLPKKQDFGLD